MSNRTVLFAAVSLFALAGQAHAQAQAFANEASVEESVVAAQKRDLRRRDARFAQTAFGATFGAPTVTGWEPCLFRMTVSFRP